MRAVWLGLALAIPLYAVAFGYDTPIDGGDERWLPEAVVGAGVVMLVVVRWFGRRHWASIPSTGRTLAGAYRRDFFIQVAIADLVALLTLVSLFMVQDSLWVYLVAGSFTLVGLWMAAPTSANIARRQGDITASGSSLSLLDALLETPSK